MLNKDRTGLFHVSILPGLLLAAAMAVLCLTGGAAAQENWIEQFIERYALESPSASYQLSERCPTPGMSLSCNFTLTQPGVLLDTVGINDAAAGQWTISVLDDWRFSFQVFDQHRGWLRHVTDDVLSTGVRYWLTLEVSDSELLVLISDDADREIVIYSELDTNLTRGPVWVGDYPGDDGWGAQYPIHPAATGRLEMYYFGPVIRVASAETFAQSYVIRRSPAPPGTTPAAPPARPGVETDPFVLDYEFDTAAQQAYEQADCLEAMAAASPFYAGNSFSPGVQTGEFDALRRAKVDEIMAEAGQVVMAARDFAPRLEELSGAYLAYLGQCLQADPGLEEFAVCTARTIAADQAARQSAQDTFTNCRTDSGDAFTDSYMQYTQVVSAQRLAGLSLKCFDDICIYGALLTGDREATGTEPPGTAAFLDAMSATDRLDAGLQAIADGMARVDYGLRQLETADYHVAQAGLEFIEEQLPAVEADVAAIRERPGVTADHIKLANDNLAWVRGVHQALKDGYSEMDTSRLISLAPYAPQSPGGLTNCLCALLGCTIAHAESGRGSYRSGCDSVRGGIDLVGEDRSLAAHRPGWKDIRKAIRGGQTTLGAGVDAIGATIGSISREAAGRYYGNTPEERWKDIKDNFEQVARNWREGTSGSSTYRTLKNGMEQAENAAQAVTRDFVRKTMGGHFAPWAAGKLAKGLVSTFTGLAKGASAVADPTSTDAELAVGVLELGMALTAGNGKVYEFSRQGVRKAMTDATGLGNAKDFLINVLEGYDDDLLKQLVGDAVDGKSLVRSFLEFLEVPPELLDPPSFDGHYSGKIKGGTSGSIHFTIQGGTWQGSVSGSIPWTLGDYQGSMSFRGSLSGSCDPESGALDGTTGGTLGDGDNPSRFSGTISGTVRNGVASGSWTTTGKDETRTGTWSATINE